MTPENKDKLTDLLGIHFDYMQGPAQSTATQTTDLVIVLRNVPGASVQPLIALLNEAKRDAFPDNVICMKKWRENVQSSKDR